MNTYQVQKYGLDSRSLLENCCKCRMCCSKCAGYRKTANKNPVDVSICLGS